MPINLDWRLPIDDSVRSAVGPRDSLSSPAKSGISDMRVRGLPTSQNVSLGKAWEEEISCASTCIDTRKWVAGFKAKSSSSSLHAHSQDLHGT